MTDKTSQVTIAINELRSLLTAILESKSSNKSASIIKFENAVNEYWKKDENFFDKNYTDIFADLISDLAYYQPNPIIRFFEKGLYGNAKLNILIKDALSKLEKY